MHSRNRPQFAYKYSINQVYAIQKADEQQQLAK